MEEKKKGRKAYLNDFKQNKAQKGTFPFEPIHFIS